MDELELDQTVRGFIVPAEPTQKEVDAVYQSLIAFNPNKSGSWETRRKGVAVAKHLLGRTFNAFVMRQLDRSFLYGRRFDFIVDTLRYIETGKRTISVDNWYELLDEYPEPNKQCSGTPHMRQTFNLYPVLTDPNFISRWCSHPKGYEDMICTLNIIAGSPRSTDLPYMRGSERLTVKHLM